MPAILRARRDPTVSDRVLILSIRVFLQWRKGTIQGVADRLKAAPTHSTERFMRCLSATPGGNQMIIATSFNHASRESVLFLVGIVHQVLTRTLRLKPFPAAAGALA